MIANLSSFIQKASNRNTFLVLLVLYILYFWVFFYADVPFGLSRMAPYTGGDVNILDMEMYYTAEQAYQRFAMFGQQGRAVYLIILTGDLIYPALLGSFLSVAITLLFRRVTPATGNWHKLNLLPVANMLADYLENIMLLTLLINYPTQINGIATVAGGATLVKNLFGLLSFLALGIGLTMYLYQQGKLWWQDRQEHLSVHDERNAP